MNVTLWILLAVLGVYCCLTPAKAGRSAFKNKYRARPTFLSTPKNITVRVGRLAKLPCSIKHLGTKQVAWGRMGEDHFLTIGTFTWVRDKRFIVEHKMHENHISDWNLLIRNVTKEYSGIYECQITTAKKISRHIHLNVVGIVLRGSKYIDVGDPISLICNATGGAQIPEEIDWFYEGDKIDSYKYPNILITKYRSLTDQSLISELMIDRSTTRDSGMYICRSSEREVDSRKVTVLVADTSNVKRGTGKSSSSLEGVRHGGASGLCSGITTHLVMFLSILFLQRVS
ncbi:leucine-rich repeats and immunoglobulin-like domains protein 1 isoform X2 [Gigantopelta aegis]|uniref:leucine-rich repeats and immunoglobulin-like domains protein 1 isoform X2 n=1 Tax=Gigantopelta aegis TaxID=1735272 RepID=UPI001B88C9BA|nr:leucine-rich repeats and immunoglobulin-like domains protein 1 isoform X2 [Gigantopelta aegis]